MNEAQLVQEYIDRARVAQQEFETWSQEKVDLAVRAIGKAVYDNGEPLARLAADESKLGKFEDKILKNKGKSKAVWNKLKNVKSRNIVRYIEEEGLVEIAKPIGVIGAILPITNPTMTPMQNAMIALKGGNAILMAPHPNGSKSGIATVDVMREALKAVGAPVDLIQCLPESTLVTSEMVMKLSDVCIATGGPGMVKAAYSSGKPSYGVGAGNVQCVIDKDADLAEAVKHLVNGRIYDNGVLCTCEQTAIVHNSQLDAVKAELVKAGGVEIVGADVDKFRTALFPNGMINKEMVGKPVAKLAEIGGISAPADAKFLFVTVDKFGHDELYTKEKLCPVLAVIGYDSWDDAIKIAKTNLLLEGTGHSSVVHSNTKENIEKLAIALPISRLVVNQQGSSGLGGSFVNGLNPTATLGCGSWGNNSIAENLWWHHLVNLSRLSYVIPNKAIPTDDEIWGD